MLEPRDKILMQEFAKALRKNNNGDVINVDEQFDKNFQFFIQRYETIIQQIGNVLPPHKWSYHRIGLVTEGSADYVAGMYRFKAEANTLLILPARITTSSEWSENGCGYVILFNPDFFIQNQFPQSHLSNKKILQLNVRPYIRLQAKEADELKTLFDSILKEKDENDPHRDELIALKLMQLVIICERLVYDNTDGTMPPASDIINRFAALLESNFMEERSVKFYAGKLNIHPNHLNALVKSQTGTTAKESIQTRLVLESKFLLHSTNLSIKEIAHKMGFDDPNYFNVFFKRSESISPAAYRSSFI